MMGLEKLLRGLYGSDPQIDMDRQLARARVPKPMTLDFAALADGIKRNNVGTTGILLEVVGEIAGGRVRLIPTGQTFLLEGPLPADPAAQRRKWKVLDWGDPGRVRLELQP